MVLANERQRVSASDGGAGYGETSPKRCEGGSHASGVGLWSPRERACQGVRRDEVPRAGN